MAPRYPLTDWKYDRVLLQVYRKHLCLLQHSNPSVLLSKRLAWQLHHNFEVSKRVKNDHVRKTTHVGLGPKRIEKHAVRGITFTKLLVERYEKPLLGSVSVSPAHGVQLQGALVPSVTA